MKIALISALSWPGRVIGKDQQLPWKLPEDIKRFKALTTGHAVLMGRKTWDSLPPKFRPLPERLNLVLTRLTAWRGRGANQVHSLQAAIDLARIWFDQREDNGETLPSEPTLWVIGGAETYALALPRADRLALTLVHHAFEGDATFPELDPTAWGELAKERLHHEGKPAFDFEFIDFQRR